MVIKKRHPKVTERLAFHEAGHCIVAHHYGFQFGHVTISPNHELGSEGETLLVHRASSLLEALLTAAGIPNRSKLEQLLVVLMAGIEAVKLLRKRTNFTHYWESKSDIERAHSIASQLGHKQEIGRHFAVAKAAVEASKILKSKQETLSLLARALIKNSELPGEEVIRLIETARAPDLCV